MAAVLLRIATASWRMLVALLIGLALYVLVFLYEFELFNTLHRSAGQMIEQASMPADTERWLHLVKITDKLVFMVFILAGRIIWALIEYLFIQLPYYLMSRRSNSDDEVSGQHENESRKI